MEFLDNALNMLSLSFMRGYKNLSGWINGLLALIFLIDLLFLAIKWMLGMKDVKETANKVLNYGVWFLAVLIFPYFMNHIQQMFTSVGLTAGSNASKTTIEKLLDAQNQFFYGTGTESLEIPQIDTNKVPAPSVILTQGLKNAQPLINAANDTYTELGARIFYLICWIIMMIAYVIMTIQYLVTYLEFSVLIGIGGIFMPFGLMQETRFLSEKFLGAAAGHGVKIMLLNFIFSVGNLVLANISGMLKNNLCPDTILTVITISFLFMMLAQNIPAMAVGILSGTPALNDAHLANTLRTAGAAAGAMRTVGQLAAAGVHGGLQGGASVVGGIAKAVGAANKTAQDYVINVDTAGQPVTKRGTAIAWAGGTGGSLLRSAFNSMVSGAGKGLNWAMWGKDAKNMPQFQKPDSLRNVGRAGEYISTRFNAGKKEGGYKENIANNRNFRDSTRVPFFPHFAAKPLTFAYKPGPAATKHYVPKTPDAPVDAAAAAPAAASPDHDKKEVGA